ncbi:hypothetical protein OFM21_34650, partial [Escherichia coli]|nr:hypothetical protein [Escherichia coli]
HGEPVIKKYRKITGGIPVQITTKEPREERIITGPEIKYIQIKFVRGSTFKEIPMTVYRPAMTKIHIEGEPDFRLIK